VVVNTDLDSHTSYIGSGDVFGIGSGNDGSSGGKHLYAYTFTQAGKNICN